MMTLTVATTAGENAGASGFDVVELVGEASGPGLVVLAMLFVASILVWIIWLAKWMQLQRLVSTQRHFERVCDHAHNGDELLELANQYKNAPGAAVVLAIGKRIQDATLSSDLLAAVARRAITTEEQRSAVLMPTLSSIASASPFIGLFGTVWGIMIAFQRIGAEKSASLPVVAPAIGEALIATAFGLFAAIPATIAYNYLDKRIGDLTDELSAASDVWVARIFEDEMQNRKNGRGGAL